MPATVTYKVSREGNVLSTWDTVKMARNDAKCRARNGLCNVWRKEDHGSWAEETWVATYYPPKERTC